MEEVAVNLAEHEPEIKVRLGDLLDFGPTDRAEIAAFAAGHGSSPNVSTRLMRVGDSQPG
jgi:hypothetical protein